MAGTPQPTPGPGGTNRGLLRSPLRRRYGDPRHFPAARVNQSDRSFQPHRRQHSHSLPVASARASPSEPTTSSTRAQPLFPRLMSRRRRHRDPASPTGAKEHRPSFSPNLARKGPQAHRTQACTHGRRPTNQAAHHRRRKTHGRRLSSLLLSLETTAPSNAPSTVPGPIRTAPLVTTTRPLHVTATATGASDLHYQAHRSPIRTMHSLATQHLHQH